MITVEENRLIYKYDSEILQIESWGKNAVRIRAGKGPFFEENNWALSVPQSPSGTVRTDKDGGVLENGNAVVRLSNAGKIHDLFKGQKEDSGRVYEKPQGCDRSQVQRHGDRG